MALVHEYVWYVLAGALLLGFGLAWILRGLKKSPEEQRAIVDRDIALLELQQTKDELDSLFAAQRKWKAQTKAAVAEGADPALKAEVERLQAELAALREAGAERPEAEAEAGAPASSSSRAGEEASLRNALIARNEYLEERIHDVELRLHHMAKEKADAETLQPAETGASESCLSKEAYLARYLVMRAEALQARLQAVRSAAPEEAPSSMEARPDAPDESGPSERDEEVARLRWRNRYLESRLAYLDQPSETAVQGRRAEVTDQSAAPVSNSPEPIRASEPARPSPRPAQPNSAQVANAGPDRFAVRGPRFTSPMSALASAGAAQQTAAAQQTKEEKPLRPPSRPAPEGAADDLTRLSGLSSSIELKLNEIGVWHFSQIAEWTPANLAWVDEAFDLDGQARREGWISQARQLVG